MQTMLLWFNLFFFVNFFVVIFVFLQLNQRAQKLSVSATETVCRPAVQWEPTYPSVTIMGFIDHYRLVFSSLL